MILFLRWTSIDKTLSQQDINMDLHEILTQSGVYREIAASYIRECVSELEEAIDQSFADGYEYEIDLDKSEIIDCLDKIRALKTAYTYISGHYL
jgi:hypothetical protein